MSGFAGFRFPPDVIMGLTLLACRRGSLVVDETYVRVAG
jgi:hypothetical protein